jgi:hypothetical protein
MRLSKTNFGFMCSVILGLLILPGLVWPVILAQSLPDKSASTETKQNLSGQKQSAPGGTDQTPTSSGKAEARRLNSKLDAAEANKKKAEELLNRCYQDALNSEPEVKADALNRIAKAMGKSPKERVLPILQQAFDATTEIQSQDSIQQKIQAQYSIVMMTTTRDLEKALQMALRMDRQLPTTDSPQSGVMNFRANALGMIASRLVGKDPDQAFEIVQQLISEGNFEPNFLAPVATAFKKNSPDKSEQLFIEAIHQFDKPTHGSFQVKDFVDLTARLFDLNHALSAKALDLIIPAIDDLEKTQQEEGLTFSITNVSDKGKTSVNSIREYVAIQAVAMMRRLDPERAKTLQETYARYNDLISKNPNGLLSIGSDGDSQTSAPKTSTENVQTTETGLSQTATTTRSMTPGNLASSPPAGSSSSSVNQTIFVVRNNPGGNSGSKPLDPNKWASQIQSQMQVDNAVRNATRDPQSAINSIAQIDSPADRAKAMARIAAAIYKTEPEKAKSLLGDAYTAAEKVSDPFDRGEIYGYIADGYLNFDRDRAQAVLTEAFDIANRAFETEANAPTSTPTPSRVPPEFRRSNLLYQHLLNSLSRLNVDEAIARADQISDKRLKLIALINIADSVLNDGQSNSSEIRIVLN